MDPKLLELWKTLTPEQQQEFLTSLNSNNSMAGTAGTIGNVVSGTGVVTKNSAPGTGAIGTSLAQTAGNTSGKSINSMFSSTGSGTTPDPYSSIGAGANMVGQLGATAIDTFGKKDSRFVNVNQEAAKGTLRGAGTGAMLGANPLLAGATGGLSIVAGAIIGGAVGGISSGVGAKKQQKETAEHYKDIYYGKDSDKMYFPYAGGSKFAMGGNLANQMPVEVDGNSHEQGGVPLGVSNNEVEGNEVIWNNFVFSDRLPYDDSITFADQAKKIMKKYKGREGDTYSSKSMKNEMERLKAAHQDALTAMEQQLQAEQQQDMDDVAQYGDAINTDESGKFSVDPAMQQQMFEMAKQRGVGMNQLTNKIGMNKFRYGGMIKQYAYGGGWPEEGPSRPLMVNGVDYSYLTRNPYDVKPPNSNGFDYGTYDAYNQNYQNNIPSFNNTSQINQIPDLKTRFSKDLNLPNSSLRSLSPSMISPTMLDRKEISYSDNMLAEPKISRHGPSQYFPNPPRYQDWAAENESGLNLPYDELDPQYPNPPNMPADFTQPLSNVATSTTTGTPAASSDAKAGGSPKVGTTQGAVTKTGLNKDGKKGSSTPADRFRFGREEAALMASSTAALDNIMKGLKPEVSRLKRVSFERLNLEDLRRLNRINADRQSTQMGKSIRGSGRSSGEVLSALASSNAAIASGRMGQDAQSYLQEEQANNQISNQEVQTNNQIAMQEYMNNEQNRAMAKSVGNLGLANLGQNYQGYLRDKTLDEKNLAYNDKVQNLINQMFPNYKFGTDPETDKFLLQYLAGPGSAASTTTGSSQFRYGYGSPSYQQTSGNNKSNT